MSKDDAGFISPDDLQNYKQAVNRLYIRLQRDPTLLELSDELGVPVPRVKQLVLSFVLALAAEEQTEHLRRVGDFIHD